jgi:phosphoribosyl-AMP cyclohydrolase
MVSLWARRERCSASSAPARTTADADPSPDFSPQVTKENAIPMNDLEEASLREKIAVLGSTSRNELWRKGSTSGDILSLVEIRVNCEQNSLLYLVRRSTGGACHTRLPSGAARPTCYYRTLVDGRSLRPARM